MDFINPNHYLEGGPTDFPSRIKDLYTLLMQTGEAVISRTGKMWEVIGVSFDLHIEDLDLLDTYFNNPLGGHPRLLWARGHQKQFITDLLTGQDMPIFEAKGSLAYAEAVAKLPGLIDLLRADPASRRAVIIIGADTCYSSLQVLTRGGKLWLLMSARSVNLTTGLHRDANFWDTQVLRPLAGALNLPIGGIHFSVGSLHCPKTGLDF
jgi:hypothetical protein